MSTFLKDWYYVDQTSNLEKRLKEHNNYKAVSTKHKTPFKIVYSKPFENRMGARDYEMFLKIRSNKEKLIKSIG